MLSITIPLHHREDFIDVLATLYRVSCNHLGSFSVNRRYGAQNHRHAKKQRHDNI